MVSRAEIEAAGFHFCPHVPIRLKAGPSLQCLKLCGTCKYHAKLALEAAEKVRTASPAAAPESEEN